MRFLKLRRGISRCDLYGGAKSARRAAPGRFKESENPKPAEKRRQPSFVYKGLQAHKMPKLSSR
jgi:hypothetical protein